MPLNGSINRTIQIGLKFDTTPFVRQADQAADSLKLVEQNATKAQTAVDHIKPPSGAPTAGSAPAAGGAADESMNVMERLEGAGVLMAARIRSAITAAIAPLGELVASMAGKFDLVGGTVVEFADKMNYLSKRSYATLDVMMQMLDKIGQKMKAFTTADIKPIPVPMRAKDLIFMSTQAAGVKKRLDSIGKTSFAAATAGASKLNTTIGALSKTATSAAAPVQNLGRELLVAFGFAGVIYSGTRALMSFIHTGVTGAISLVETENKVTQAFGASGAKVTAYAEGMAAAFGMPKGAALDAASSIGLMATGAGQTKEAAAGLAIQMTQLAADTASLYHIPLPDALAKIQSALAGESKPLRELGVMMSEDGVKAQAMEMGFIKAGEELNEAGKIAARSQLIFKGLTAAHGDLGKTQDTTANQLARFKGTLENLATSVGALFLPAITRGVTILAEFAASASVSFEVAKTAVQPFIDSIVSGFDTMRDVVLNFPTYAKVAFLKVEEAAINGLSWVETIPANLALVAGYVAGNWKELIVDSVNAVGNVFKNLGENIGALFSAMHDWASGKGFNFEWKGLLEGFQATADKLPEFIKPQIISMDAEIGKLWKDLEKNRVTTLAKHVSPPVVETPKLAGGAVDKDKDKKKGSGYQGVGAMEIGSSEAGSSIARFLNQGSGTDARKTADNTKETAKNTKTMAQALREIAARGGNAGKEKLSTFTF